MELCRGNGLAVCSSEGSGRHEGVCAVSLGLPHLAKQDAGGPEKGGRAHGGQAGAGHGMDFTGQV